MMSRLTVRLLKSRTGAAPAVLLRLAPPRIGHQQIPIVRQERRLEFVLGALVDVLGVIGHDALGDGRSDGVHLRRHPSALDAYANVERGEFVLSEDQDRLVDLEAKSGGFDVFDGLAVDLDETAALFGEGAGGGGLLPVLNGGKSTKL